MIGKDDSSANWLPSRPELSENFSRKFGCTPREYRKQHVSDVKEQTETGLVYGEVSYMSLTQYATLDEANLSSSHRTLEPLQVTVDVTRGRKPVRLCHKKVANIGYAKHVLLGSVQNLLQKSVREIGFSYIFVHGILDRGLDVYHIDEEGRWFLNFTYLDMVVDYLVAIGCIPWLEFSYTPPELVENDHNYFGESCMNLPDDLRRWEEIVAGVLRHFLSRYGQSEVEKWHFSMESAVYLYYGVFSLEQYKEYYEKYDGKYRS